MSQDQEPEDDVIPLNRKEKKVTLDEGGTKKKYVLREMNGTERDKWLDTLQPAMRLDPNTGKPVGVKSFGGMVANLIAACLFDLEGRPVPVATIQSRSSTAQDALYERCEKMNGLDKKREKEEKKFSPTTTESG